MKTINLLGMLGLLLSACTPDTAVPPNLDREALYNRFNGTYEVISSVSNVPVDVNRDGEATTDMMQELNQLNRAYGNNLIVYIMGKERLIDQKDLKFLQWWPEQHIYLRTEKRAWQWEPVGYDPQQTVNYASRGIFRSFRFMLDLTKIETLPSAPPDASLLWETPRSVDIVGEHAIEIVNRKTLYTTEGVKEVIITTRYERFTTTT
jgi:hypothetical protein